MKIIVMVTVDIDLDAWVREYQNSSKAEALADAVSDLSDPITWLTQPKWHGLARVTEVRARA